MIDIVLAFFNLYNDGSVVGPACLGVMLDDQISSLRVGRFPEIPFFRILYKIFAVGTGVVFIVKSCNGVDARFELLS